MTRQIEKIAIISCLVLDVACCHEHQETPLFTYVSEVTRIEDSVRFDDIVCDYRLVPLQAAYGLGEIKDFMVVDSLFYIVSDGVYCYNNEGKFKFAIREKGHAHNEYVRISSVNIYKNKLFLYDVMQNKILVFESSDGTYINTITMPHTVTQVFCNKENIIADRADLACTVVPDDERFFVISQNDPEHVINAFREEDEDRIPIEGQTSFHENGLFFSDYWKCQTWKIDDNKCTPYFEVRFPAELSLTKGEITELEKNKILSTERLSTSTKIWGLRNVHENDSHITGNLRIGSSMASIIYSKKTGMSIVYKDVSNEGPWQPKPMSFIHANKDKVYTIIPSEDLCLIKNILNISNSPRPDSENNSQYDIFCSVKESDGPVVIEYILK